MALPPRISYIVLRREPALSMLNGWRAWRQWRRAQNYLEQGACRKAAAVYAQALRRRPQDPAAGMWRGVALAECGQCQQAQEQVDRARAAGPSAGTGPLLLARVLYDCGQSAPARTILQQYLEKEDNQQASGLLALCLFRDGDREQAGRLLSGPLPHAPWLLARWLAAIELEAQRKPASAPPPAGVLVPEPAPAGRRPGWLARRAAASRLRRGLVRLRTEKWEEALRAFDRAQKGLPEDPRVGYGIGVSLYYLNHLEPARRRLLKAVDKLAEPFGPDALATLGKIGLEIGDAAEALLRLRQAIAAGAASPENHYALGLLLLRRNHPGLARKAFQKCATVAFVRQRFAETAPDDAAAHRPPP